MAEEKLLVKRDGEFCYPIYFENDFSFLSQALTDEGLAGKSMCIVSDSTVAPLYADQVKAELLKVSDHVYQFTFPAGEAYKNLDTVQDLFQCLIENGLDRKSLVVALGGGVTGDLSGFGAAAYLRGIDFIQIPTTLLAQVDSSVGGKTGVDFRQFKNMVGAFHQPRLVYMNMATLQSLPEREFGCGMGEILKTGLICDKDFFDFVCANYKIIRTMDPEMLAVMIRKCCAIKAGVVERDPKEQGERALLNFGHTIGHAIEKLSDFSLYHGECVGLGIVAASYLSMQLGHISKEDFEKIQNALSLFELPTQMDGFNAEKVLSATKSDKKMVGNQVKFILLKEIGNAYIYRELTDEQILDGIRYVCHS